MESTKGFLKQFEDREHLSELDKKIERNKPAFRGPPVWVTRRDGEVVTATFDDLEAAAREKQEEEVEPERLNWLQRLIQIFRNLASFEFEVDEDENT